MPARMLAMAAGLVAVTRFPSLPDAAPLVAALPLLLPLACCAPRPLRLAAWFAAGLAWAVLAGHGLLARALPAELEGRDLVLRLCIEDLPVQRLERGRGEVWRLRARVLELLPAGGSQVPRWGGRRLELSWYGVGEFHAGEAWTMVARLRTPRGFVNPGGRDYQAWLHSEGIDATGYAVREARPAPRRDGRCRAGADAWRERLRTRLVALLGNEPRLGQLLALTIGDDSRFAPQEWTVFARTGTTHLMVISGMHISLVGVLAFAIGQRLARRSAHALERLPAAGWGALLALPATLGYAALAGWSVSVRRAVLMSAVVMVLVLLERRPRPLAGFALAVLVVLLLQPLAASQPGFWLSFIAVAALLAGFSGRLARASRLELLWRPQWLVALALLVPLSLLAQVQAALAPLVNAVAIPLVDLVVVPAALAGCLLLPLSEALAGPPLWLALRALDALWWVLGHAAAWSPPLPSRGGAAQAWQLALAAVGIAWLLLPRGFPGRAVGLVMMLPLLWPVRAPSPALELLVLDVGQGTAVIARTAAHTLVYDTGPRYSERFDAGRALLAPALQSLGATRVHRLLLSHADADHAGGAEGLIATLPVDTLMSGEALPGLAAERCREGMQWTWDDVRFEVLHPSLRGAPSEGNDASCVLRITAAGVRVLLAGDIEAAAERVLLRRAAGELAAEVLLVPHHGSRSSSSAAFIDAVRPRFALVSAGYRNRFGHPHPDVVARYRARGVSVLETAREGAIRVAIDAGGNIAPVEGWRARERRYWHAAGS